MALTNHKHEVSTMSTISFSNPPKANIRGDVHFLEKYSFRLNSLNFPPHVFGLSQIPVKMTSRLRLPVEISSSFFAKIHIQIL